MRARSGDRSTSYSDEDVRRGCALLAAPLKFLKDDQRKIKAQLAELTAYVQLLGSSQATGISRSRNSQVSSGTHVNLDLTDTPTSTPTPVAL